MKAQINSQIGPSQNSSYKQFILTIFVLYSLNLQIKKHKSAISSASFSAAICGKEHTAHPFNISSRRDLCGFSAYSAQSAGEKFGLLFPADSADEGADKFADWASSDFKLEAIYLDYIFFI